MLIQPRPVWFQGLPRLVVLTHCKALSSLEESHMGVPSNPHAKGWPGREAQGTLWEGCAGNKGFPEHAIITQQRNEAVWGLQEKEALGLKWEILGVRWRKSSKGAGAEEPGTPEEGAGKEAGLNLNHRSCCLPLQNQAPWVPSPRQQVTTTWFLRWESEMTPGLFAESVPAMSSSK